MEFIRAKFIIILFLLSASICNAQDLKLNISSGYALPSFKQSVEGYYDVVLDEDKSFKTEVGKSFSLGAGLYIDAGLQFCFNENIGIGLDVSYLNGQKIKFSKQDAIASVVSVNEQELFGKSIRIIPSIILRANENTFRPYLKLGFIMSKTTVELHEKITIEPDVTLREWEYKADGTKGISFVGGLSYQVVENLALFFELNFQAIKYKPSKLSMVLATENGNNIIDNFQTIEKEISYTSHIDLEYNMSPDPIKPQLLHEIYFPYSSLILQFGIQLKLF
ncbi:hypothetical protein ACFLQ5_02765 [Bacteroidota bacterium]